MTEAEDVYFTWAPTSARWSPWAKPVTFATMETSGDATTLEEVELASETTAWAPAARVEGEVRSEGYREAERARSSPGDTALLIDLPGPSSARTGVALARLGYRPVPIFAAAPGVGRGVVEVSTVQRVLRGGASILKELALPDDAPPAFLVDAERMRLVSPLPGEFDNRSMLFAEDFPSALHLRAHGVRSVLVVRASAAPVSDDLAHVLLRWQAAKLSVSTVDRHVGVPQPIELRTPKSYRSIFHRGLAMMGLRRNAAGGFGAIVPEASSGGGG